MQDRETPGDELEASLTRYTESASKLVRAQADSGSRIIAAVREYLAAFPMQGESLGLAQSAAQCDQREAVALGDLAKRSRSLGGLAQMQSLALLAAVVRWFSSESGRSESEILERLGSVFREGEDEGLAAIHQAAQAFHESKHDLGE